MLKKSFSKEGFPLLFFSGEKKSKTKEKPDCAFRRGELLGSSVSCAHPPHTIKVFEVGCGEGLFSKSPSPTTRRGSRFCGNDRFLFPVIPPLFCHSCGSRNPLIFLFGRKGKVSKRKARLRLPAQGAVGYPRKLCSLPTCYKSF
jgi:hypothetical protein